MECGAWGEARKARKARQARQGEEERIQLAGSSRQHTKVGGQKSEITKIIEQHVGGVFERGGMSVSSSLIFLLTSALPCGERQ